ncbi:ImuA family protein, partial [Sphingomonas bacterium]|uniref:ImuA family protein n=1 Tax=Sphingomonas bacterium TaxID=1895847 RepID=UPI0015772C78
GVAGLDAALGGGIARGRVHELYAGTIEDCPSAAGFALMLALKAGGPAGTLIWLGPRRTLPHAPGLVELGVAVERLLFVSVAGGKALLKAAADILRSPAAGTLVVDASAHGKAIDLTASRRLTLFAERSGVTALLLRGVGAQLPSSAETRWLVTAAPSTPIEAEAPGAPAFAVDLVRRRGGPPSHGWRLEWDRDAAAFREQALPGAVPADAGARRLAG